MKLSDKQRHFTRMIADLIQFAYESGYELTFGEAYRPPSLHGEFGEKKGYAARWSVHKLRIAIDLNLFVNGEYITDSSHDAWVILHEYWSQLGGADAIPNDSNHFSLTWQGKR